MLRNEILVLKCASIYRERPCTVAIEEIAALTHEIIDDSVENGVLVALRDVVLAMLACAQLAEVLAWRSDVSARASFSRRWRPEAHKSWGQCR